MFFFVLEGEGEKKRGGWGGGGDEVIEFRVFFLPKTRLFSLKNQTQNQIPSSI